MKGKLEFKLPEEKEEFDYACKGADLFCAVTAFDEDLRSQIKYAELDEKTREAYQTIRDKLHEELAARDIALW